MIRKSLLIIFLALPLLAFGQNNPDIPTTSIDTTSTPKHTLNEAVVYSFREGAEVKKLPASATVMPLSQLERNNVTSLKNLTAYVPNFFMPEYGSQLTSPVFIRGIGSRINSPSVGLYVDNIPYFDKASFDFDLYDIEYIEVLRGPQGTLYGRNTMGGIINVHSLSPFTYNGTRVLLSGGSYNYARATLSHYGKLGENTGFSVAGNYLHKGGYYNNIYNNEKTGKQDIASGKVRFIHRFSNRVQMELFAQYEHSEQDGYPYAFYKKIANTEIELIAYNENSLYNRDMLSAGALFEWKTADFTLRSTTSYSYLKDKQQVDQDFTPAQICLATQKQRQNMLSQELIMTSNTPGDYQWSLGVFGFWQQADMDVFLDFGTDAAAVGMPYKTNQMNYDNPTYGWAFFHQSKWNNLLINGLSFTVGLRIDGEDAKSDYKQSVVMINNPKPIINQPLIPKLNYVQALPKFTLNYAVNNTNSVYASVAKGYKTGGFNTAVEDMSDATFDPEYSWNYEVGFKLNVLNNRLTAEAAAFYIDWRNQQIYQFNQSGVGSILRNAGKSESKGFELSLKAIPFRLFTLTASYGYTHATFKDNVSINNKTGVINNYGGNYIPYVPRNTVSANAMYPFIFANSKFINEIGLNLQYVGTGSLYWDEANQHKQDFYSQFNARVSFKKSDWVELAVWAQNIFDVKYQTFYFEALGNSFIQRGKPFVIGADLKLLF